MQEHTYIPRGWIIISLFISIAAALLYWNPSIIDSLNKRYSKIHNTVVETMVNKQEGLIPKESDLFGPFNSEIIVDENKRLDFLVTPMKDKEEVLRVIKKITGNDGVYIMPDITIISNDPESTAYGDLYQYVSTNQENFFSDVYALEASLADDVTGAPAKVSFTYPRKDSDSAVINYSVSQFIDKEGKDFHVYMKLNKSVDQTIGEIVYAEQELPIVVAEHIEKDFLYIRAMYFDARHDVFVVAREFMADTENTSSNIYSLVFYNVTDDSLEVIGEKTYTITQGEGTVNFNFLLSPEADTLAIGAGPKYTKDTLVDRNILFDLKTKTMRNVEIVEEFSVPTEWVDNARVLYGRSVGKDCGYYPYIAMANVNSSTFEKQNSTATNEWFEKYLFPQGSIYRVENGVIGETSEGSLFNSDAEMCSSMYTKKIVNLSEGTEQIIYTAGNNSYLKHFGFISEKDFIFAEYIVISYEEKPYGKQVTKAEPPVIKIVNIDSNTVKDITEEQVLALLDAYKNKDAVTYERYTQIKFVAPSTLDQDYETLVLKKGDDILDVIVNPSSEGGYDVQDEFVELGTTKSRDIVSWLDSLKR